MNSLPAVWEHLTPNFYVDEAIYCNVDESSMLRLDPNEKLSLDEQDSILLNSTSTSPKTLIEKPTNSYVDSLHENSRKRWGLSSVFNDQDNEFDNIKLTKLDSVTVNRHPRSHNEVSNKKYVDDSIGGGTIVRHNQRLENYLKVCVGGDKYNLTK